MHETAIKSFNSQHPDTTFLRSTLKIST